MRFYFVDEITKRDKLRIAGVKTFRGFGSGVAAGAISEGIGQLASWLCLERNGFTARPVFLFADQIEILDEVPANVPVHLSAQLTRLDEENVRFSGEASINGVVVQRVTSCSGQFMPLDELEDPIQTRRRFVDLTSGGNDGTSDSASDSEAFALDSLVGQTVEMQAGESIRTAKTFAADEWFYADHFPRLPVTPIVMLNEMIGRATARMIDPPVGTRLKPRLIAGIKIRSFVKPGSICEAVVRKIGGDHGSLTTAAEVHMNGKVIMRGSYQYDVGA